MDIALPMGGETPLESSLRIATQIVTQKVFYTACIVLIRQESQICCIIIMNNYYSRVNHELSLFLFF